MLTHAHHRPAHQMAPHRHGRLMNVTIKIALQINVKSAAIVLVLMGIAEQFSNQAIVHVLATTPPKTTNVMYLVIVSVYRNAEVLHVKTTRHHLMYNAEFKVHVLRRLENVYKLMLHSQQMVRHATMGMTLPKTINVMHLVIVLVPLNVKVLYVTTIHHHQMFNVE